MTMRRISKYNLRFNYFQESEDRQTHIQYIALLIVVPPQLTCGRVVHALVVVLEQTLQFLRVLSRVRTVFLFQVGGPGVSVSIYIYVYTHVLVCDGGGTKTSPTLPGTVLPIPSIPSLSYSFISIRENIYIILPRTGRILFLHELVSS